MAREIDPQLPYIQVHRSVGAKAAQIAQASGFTPQHVRGALECFWEGMADRRFLSGKREIVLTEDEVAGRLRLAFGMAGVTLDVGLLAGLLRDAGFLEKREGGWRVRGMSRYLEAEEKRSRISNARRTQVDSKSTSSPPQVELKSTSSAPQVDMESTSSRQRRETRGERREEEKKGAAAVAPLPGWNDAQDRLVRAFQAAKGQRYVWGKAADSQALKALLAHSTPEAIEARWVHGLKLGAKWPGVATVAQLAQRWNDLADGARAQDSPSPQGPRCAVCGTAEGYVSESWGQALCSAHMTDWFESGVTMTAENAAAWVAKQRAGRAA